MRPAGSLARGVKGGQKGGFTSDSSNTPLGSEAPRLAESFRQVAADPEPQQLVEGVAEGIIFGRNYSNGQPEMCEEEVTMFSKCWKENNLCDLMKGFLDLASKVEMGIGCASDRAGCKHQVKTQSRTQAMVKSTIKSLAGCMHAKAAIEALENLDGPQCRVMATWQLAEIPLGFYSAIIMWRLFGQDVAVRAGCSAGLVAHATAFHLSKHPAHAGAAQCTDTCLAQADVSPSICRSQCRQICELAPNFTKACDLLRRPFAPNIAAVCPVECADSSDPNTCRPGTVCKEPDPVPAADPEALLSMSTLIFDEGAHISRRQDVRSTAQSWTAVTLLYNTSGPHAAPGFLNLLSGALQTLRKGAGSEITDMLAVQQLLITKEPSWMAKTTTSTATAATVATTTPPPPTTTNNDIATMSTTIRTIAMSSERDRDDRENHGD
eukprot:s5238_g3.t1